jgi:hypothetical protein
MATAPAAAWPITPLALDGAWPHLAKSTLMDCLLPAPWSSLCAALADRWRIERELDPTAEARSHLAQLTAEPRAH